jgi:UDP-glucuronate decarboxylase
MRRDTFFGYCHQHNVDIKITRISNTYGPRMYVNGDRVVSNFIAQALRGEDITLYGADSQARSFCYCDDLIEGFIRLMTTDDEVVGPMNLGNPSEFTIKELVEIVIEMIGSKPKLVYQPLPSDDPKQRKPGISFTKKELCWEPTIKLRDRLRGTIDYFDEYLKNSD